MNLGGKIRQIREDRGLSLRKLAAESKVSPSLISQIENNKIEPSVSTLRKISSALAISLFHLMIEETNENNGQLVRKVDRRIAAFPASGLEWEIIHSDSRKKIGLMIGALKPKSSTSDDLMSHPGEECVLILEGSMQVEFPGQIRNLESSDSFYFNSSVPHRLKNHTELPCRFLSVITPPRF